jgi:hypothetical protein
MYRKNMGIFEGGRRKLGRKKSGGKINLPGAYTRVPHGGANFI